MFPTISPKQSFPALESEVLAYWKANNTFQKSIDSRPVDNPYRFYDGPPFITGTPHYGSLLSSVVKDVVGRYWTMRGKRVDRIWGWDCHGLPIEERVQKKLGLKSNKEIEERGVKEFIDGCYEYTAATSAEWEWYIDKIGRWVDMDNAYRTMDQDYMESVMWVFSELWKKGLIYEGKRVSLYSWKLGTPISNFEVAMDDTYQEVNDPAITVKFKLEKNDKFPEGTKVLAWTTTPWTIPANMALAVRNDIDYVLVSPLLKEGADGKEAGDFPKTENPQSSASLQTAPFKKEPTEQFIVAKNRVESVFKGKGEYSIIREFQGSELVGLGYIPPFPEYYYDKFRDGTFAPIPLIGGTQGGIVSEVTPPTPPIRGGRNPNHKIYHADFITDTDGTGIGHEAPEFGDVDFQLAKREGIFISEAMDEAGKYTSQIFDYEGTHYLDLENPEKGANRINIERMKANNTLFKLEGITHRVPFCPRSGTPLMQKAQASWFIDIQSQKEKLLKANEQINWFPEHLKFGRFAKGIESAPDWCISRTRYWGAPMPVWQNQEGSERVVVSSREEIFKQNKPYGQLTKVIFVRHGETDYNEKKIIDTLGKARLTETGKNHSNTVQESLQHEHIDTIYCSPFQRCIDTIDPLAKSKNKEIIIDESLKEFQILSSQEKEKKGLLSKVLQTSPKIEGDETVDELLHRAKVFLQKVVSENTGKTVVICSHYYTIAAIRKILHHFDWDTEHAKNGLPNNINDTAYKPSHTEYIFSDSCKPFNLHKPYIDSIFLAPKNDQKEKKVLAIHGKKSDINGENWKKRRKIFSEKGIELEMFQFDRSVDPTYESWKETFDTIDFGQYDTVFTSSLGGQMLALYLLEKSIRVPRIVMGFPGMGKSTEEGSQPNLMKIWDRLEGKDLSIIADEIFVFHAQDDEEVPFRNGERFAQQLGATLVSYEQGGHNLWEQLPTVGEYIKYGKQRKVLGVHGYCRTESVVDFLEGTRVNLEKEGIHMNAPLFEKGGTVTYTNWVKKFDELDFSNYDTVLTHSLGSRAVMNYIVEHEVQLDHLVMVAPGMESATKEVQDFYDSLSADVAELKNYVKEVIVLASRDDVGREGKAKTLAELVGARYIEVDGYKHFNMHESQLIEGLVLHGEPLTRIPEVLDVWMDSGSMPYAQMHYPFENKGEMEASFPADFIAEYVGQVRAWFYVMHVLGVLLGSSLLKGSTPQGGGISLNSDSERENPQSATKQADSSFQKEPSKPTPAFTNVITTGVINGNDGRKMSKSFGNYPDPRVTIEKYGADPIRFYMLNSPLLSGGDMDFKEEQIIETVKGVMLPIWNTYSFFTTYANIDSWGKNETEVWFTRHAESTSNFAGRMSDGTDNPDLTEKGREQAKSAGQSLKEQGKKFDVIIHTDRIRATDTARIIGEELIFSGEYIIDDRFLEQNAGEYAGKTLQEVANMGNITLTGPGNHPELRMLYKNNSVENIEQFEQRILSAYEDILEKHRGKKILIVAHAGTSRPILHNYFGKSLEDAHYHRSISNAEPFRLMTTPLVNDLDRWILSKLQVLTGQVHDAMDGYDISRACRSIVDYMDEMTNWYVRLSRRRFWGSEMTPDKASAYETLYTVLVELSKLLAPYMPFLSEAIYKGLHLTPQSPLLQRGEVVPETPSPLGEGWGEVDSVHLQYITRPSRHLIDNELNRDMEICEHIVSLGLALRSRRNIRVRQPLQSITITKELSEYYQTIIRDELNVKEVNFENPERLAKKICKPDARKIGPKYGKDVQYIIGQAKAGNFVEKANGQIVIARNEAIQISEPTGSLLPSTRDRDDDNQFVLEYGEYMLEYLPLEGVGDVEGGYGMVISLDTTITEDLRLEGYARDLIRTIQDMRKEANYNVTDRVDIAITGGVSTLIMADWKSYIERETLSKVVDTIDVPDIEKKITDDEIGEITLQIKR